MSRAIHQSLSRYLAHLMMRLISLVPVGALRGGLNLFPLSVQSALKKLYRHALSKSAGTPLSRTLIAEDGTLRILGMDVSRPEGVNVIGYIFAEMGMGELSRMGLRCLATTPIAAGALNHTLNMQHAQGDNEFAHAVMDTPRYRTNLFCLNTDGLYACSALHPEWSQGRYNIHYLAWELEQYPASWMPAMNLVHEIWTISQFVAAAVSMSSSVPVIAIGQAISCFPEHRKTRQDFNLPPDKFVFLFSFDISSMVARKNPQAVIAAFLKAFPLARNEAVHLVIKINLVAGRADHQDVLKKLSGLAAADPRISFISETLSRGAMADLLNLADCYISLHRAEGLGCGIAESMLLGKPVIATGYSGNMEYMRPDNACIVDYQLTPIAKGEYIFAEGQHWAEPDIEHAAFYIKKVVSDSAFAKAIARRGQQMIQAHFSPEAIGGRMHNRLAKMRFG